MILQLDNAFDSLLLKESRIIQQSLNTEISIYLASCLQLQIIVSALDLGSSWVFVRIGGLIRIRLAQAQREL